jgi:eukaryotic-like serine/threonine-protein kinase
VSHQHPLEADDVTTLGPYQLTARLAVGGRGAAYLATAPSGDQVTVVMHATARDAPTRARAMSHLLVARTVSGPGVARVIDANLYADLPYVVSEYVEGPTLAEAVGSLGPLEGSALDHLALETARALAAIHRSGIAHGDVAPENVVLGADGARIVNLATGRAGAGAPGAPGGPGTTHAVIAPEQVGPWGARTPADVFAWGSTMVFAASGRSPFEAATASARAHRVLHSPPDLCGLPQSLADVVRDCLAKDPALRPTADHVVDRLHAAAGDPDVDSEMLASLPRQGGKAWRARSFSPDEPLDDPDGGGPASPPQRARLVTTGVALAGVLLLGLLGAAGWWRMSDRDPGARETTGAVGVVEPDQGAGSTAPASSVPATATTGSAVPGAPTTSRPSDGPGRSGARTPSGAATASGRPTASGRSVPSRRPAPSGGAISIPRLAVSATFAGTWQGEAVQPLLARGTLPVRLSLAAGADSGTLLFPSEGCTARLDVIAADSDGTRITLLQNTTSDPARRCASTALIELTAARDGSLAFAWQDAAVLRNTATAILSRTGVPVG